MKYCSKCGKELVDEAVVCVHCGCMVASASPTAPTTGDAPSIGYAVLGFLIPIVGLILYLINKDTAPMKARSAGKGALIGFCVGIAFSVLYGVLFGALFALL